MTCPNANGESQQSQTSDSLSKLSKAAAAFLRQSITWAASDRPDLVLAELRRLWGAVGETGKTPTAWDIAAVVGCSVSSVRSDLRELARQGRVVAIGNSSQRRYIPTDMYEEVIGAD